MTGTRARVVAAAAELFRAHGVHGTGVTAILDRAHAPRGSLYHHFPGGKPELVLAGLEFEASRMSRDLDALLATDSPPKAALIAFAEGLASTLERSDFRLGCPVTTAALELASEEEAVRQLCSTTYARWQRAIRDHLKKHGCADADQVAETMLSAVEGALVLARSHRDADIVRRVGAMAAQLVH